VIALGAFCWFLVGSLLAGLRVARDRRVSSDVSSLAGALAATMATWIVMGVVENQLIDRYLFVPCGFIVALIVALQASRPAEPRADAAIDG
jgi:hypothetical protein